MEFLQVVELLNSRDESKMMTAVKGWGKELPVIYERLLVDAGYPKLIEAYDRPLQSDSLDYLIERHKNSKDEKDRRALENAFCEVVKTTKLNNKQIFAVSSDPLMAVILIDWLHNKKK